MRYPNGASFSPPIPRLGRFGRRSSPGGIGTTNHKGVDYALPLGTPLEAVAAGEVVYRGYLGGWGNHVKVQHSGGVRTTYSHMQSATVVKLGQQLDEGDRVGNVGLTGNTTGPHVHFEILVNGVYVDPEKYLAARVRPAQQSAPGGGVIITNPKPPTPNTQPPAQPSLEDLMMTPYPHLIVATENSTHTFKGDTFLVTHDSVDHVTGGQLTTLVGKFEGKAVELDRGELNSYADVHNIDRARFVRGAHWRR
jgi:hypothetical protein